MTENLEIINKYYQESLNLSHDASEFERHQPLHEMLFAAERMAEEIEQLKNEPLQYITDDEYINARDREITRLKAEVEAANDLKKYWHGAYNDLLKENETIKAELEKKNIKCDMTDCVYNNNKKCSKDTISIYANDVDVREGFETHPECLDIIYK